MKHPKEITDWVNSHKGMRTPVHAPGKYKDYSTGRSSPCWGSHGGITVGGYKIAVCQPSPQRVGDTPVMFYDYIKLP